MQSVIGVFDTREDAESARESLIRAGFNENDVRVQSHRSVQSREASTAGRSEDEDAGFMTKVGHFFSELFGGSDDDAGHYAEHVRRGGSVVVVDVDDESRVNKARSALASAGAVDIDRRTEVWRKEGYSGFADGARPSPYGADEVQAEIRVSRLKTRPVQEQVELREERAETQRRPVDHSATEADLRPADNGAIELEERTERPVFNKTNTVSDVEKSGVMSGSSSEADLGMGMSGSTYSTAGSGSDALSAARTFSGDETSQSVMSWQERHANSPAYSDRVGATSATNGSMSPDDEMAYRFGSTLPSDQRYAGRSSWDEVEADARADWSERNPNSDWERAKTAVRKGWESMSGRR